MIFACPALLRNRKSGAVWSAWTPPSTLRAAGHERAPAGYLSGP